MIKKDITIKNLEMFSKNSVPRKMIGHLIKEDISSTGLAKKIYNNKKIRGGIIKWLKYFEEQRWIERKDKVGDGAKLFRAKLDIIGYFNSEEKEFVEFIVSRFWNPIRTNPIQSLKDLIIECLIIKHLYFLKRSLNGYSPKKDFEKYEKEKIRFWEEFNYRKDFLDKLEERESRHWNKYGSPKKGSLLKNYIKRDFILVSLMTPDSIFDKITEQGYISMDNPLHMTLSLLRGWK